MESVEEIKARHKREVDALNSILLSETGLSYMQAAAHPLIRGHVADAHAKELWLTGQNERATASEG